MVAQWLQYAADSSHGLGKPVEGEGNEKALDVLEARLRSRKYIITDRITIADIVIAKELSGLNLSAYPAVCEFHRNVMNHDCFKDLNVEKGKNSTTTTKVEEEEGQPPVGSQGGGGPKLVDVPDNLALKKLSELGISHQTYAHRAAFTVEEQMEVISELKGAKTKNLFLRDKKHGLFLVTASHDAKTDTKTIASKLKLSGANLRFADAATLDRVLGVAQGSVGPLSLLNDNDKEVTFVLDAALAESEIINSHPLCNDHTTAVTSSDMIVFAEATGHPPVILDFSAPAESQSGGDGKNREKHSSSHLTGSKSEKKTATTKKHHERASESTKNVKKDTLLGIDKLKGEDFSGWYQQVITFSEMIDYTDISGCYILRPWGFEVWELIQRWFDDRIKELGVSNTYFPLFVSQKALESEKDHVEGFAPEVAWVTKSGDSDLTEPIAVRPTSETIMYPAFSRWIRSHRDLPLKLNQWSNIVRWEFRDPTPFLRSREFLWQEGHTAHEKFEESEDMVYTILELYKRVYEELLAVPVIKGVKTESEKFAGGLATTTVEAYISGSGRAIQGATSHNLGQNFGKMFDITYESKQGQHEIPWQTSWGITTRSVGVCVMCHGDDMGLVLPPRVAPRQVVVIPIFSKKFGLPALSPFMSEVVADLKGAGIRVEVDVRDNYTAGWKYNHWEQKGVPIRIEIGPHDVKARSVIAVRRDDGSKHTVAFGCGGGELGKEIKLMLEKIQTSLFARALQDRNLHYSKVTCWEDFVPALERHDIIMAPFCNEAEWEEKVKERSREEALCGVQEDNRVATSLAAKALCIPLEQPDLPSGTKCFISGKPAVKWVLWGRSY